MRFVATVLMWLITTVLLALAVPAAWVQQHLVDTDGYAALAQKAATDLGLQAATAGELTTQVARMGTGVNTGDERAAEGGVMKRTFLVTGYKPAYGKAMNDFIAACDLGIKGSFVEFRNLVTATVADDATADQLARQAPAIEAAYKKIGCENLTVSEITNASKPPKGE